MCNALWKSLVNQSLTLFFSLAVPFLVQYYDRGIGGGWSRFNSVVVEKYTACFCTSPRNLKLKQEFSSHVRRIFPSTGCLVD